MSLTPADKRELLNLADARFDGVLTEVEQQRLCELLHSGSEAVDLYLDNTFFHTVLRWECADANDAFGMAPAVVAKPKKKSKLLPIFIAIAATVALALVLFNRTSAVETLEVAANPAEVTQEIPVHHLERVPGRLVDFGMATAIVIREHQRQMTPVTSNELVDGRYELASGLMEVQYQSGTRVVFEGPASFTLDGFRRLHLHSGKVRARVPLNAVGFQVIAPSATITDLSTEFGVFVEADDSVCVHTFDGLLEVAETRTNSTTRLPAPNGQWFGNATASGAIPSFATAETIQTENYNTRRDWILGTFDCAAYYDFQPSSDASKLIDHANDHDGAIIGADWVQGRWQGKSALQFENDGDQVKLELPFGLYDFTLSVWLKVDRLSSQYGTILNADGWDPGRLHFQVTEFGEVNLAIGPSVAIRKKDPVGPWIKWNAPLQTIASSEWIHLAVVANATKKSVSHFLDGKLVNTRAAPGLRAATFGTSTIGHWNNATETYGERPFRGRIDELIIIRQALSPNQITKLAQP